MPPSAAMSAADFALARNLMVDGQLRPTRVNDRRILGAMRSLKRETFVPDSVAELAYIDDNVALGGGRVLLNPLVLARLIQLAQPREGEAALLVGAGSGYGAAVLAACGVHVTALEEDAALLSLAGRNPHRLVNLVQGPLAQGWPAGAPYDLIIIEGGVPEIPDAIAAQVSANGRLVTVLVRPPGPGVAVLAEPSTGGLRARAAFDANAPLIPSLVPAPVFTF